MDIFLDTLDLELIKKYNKMGILSGVTTNPTLARKFNMPDDVEMISIVREVIGNKEVHVEAIGRTAEEIVENALRLRRSQLGWEFLVFKIPFSEKGVEAVHILKSTNITIKTNLHLIFSHNQVQLSTAVGTDYICPLVGRLDDSGHDAMLFIQELTSTFRTIGEKTKVMVSSVRHPMHVVKAYKAGAHVITVPPSVLEQMFHHALTEEGIKKFEEDINESRTV